MAKLEKRLESLEGKVLARAFKPASQMTDSDLLQIAGFDPNGPAPTNDELQAVIDRGREKHHAKP